jgi:hypothetical protein
VNRPGLITIAGGFWILFAVGFAVVLVEYLAEGAGLQLLGWNIFAGTVLIGAIHVIGLVIASTICFCVGVSLCSHGLVRNAEERGSQE